MYHTVIVAGYVGNDPEMRFLPSGQAVTSFNLATSRQYPGSDGQTVKETIWFRVKVWTKQAESCNTFLKKGSRVLVEGRLVPDLVSGGPKIWKHNDGTPGASYELSAGTVRFLFSRGEGEASQGGSFDAAPASDSGEGDIPF